MARSIRTYAAPVLTTSLRLTRVFQAHADVRLALESIDSAKTQRQADDARQLLAVSQANVARLEAEYGTLAELQALNAAERAAR